MRAGTIGVGGEGGAAQIGLEAADTPAPAGAQGHFIGARPGQGGVAPFAGDAVAPIEHGTIHHDATADAGAEDDAEHGSRARARAVGRFADGETIRIVAGADGPLQGFGKIGIERVAIQALGIGVFNEAGGATNGAGDADTDRGGGAKTLLRRAHQTCNRGDGAGIAVRRGNPVAVRQAAVMAQGGDFDFGAAKINADSVGGFGAVL
jgi:hypothetical protein